MKSHKNLIVVLADGTTWSALSGCRIYSVTDAALQSMEMTDMTPDDLRPWDVIDVVQVSDVMTVAELAAAEAKTPLADEHENDELSEECRAAWCPVHKTWFCCPSSSC